MTKINLLYLLLVVLTYSYFPAKAQEYPKTILPGDYPDPTIVRDGADYYMTHSPFYYMPGFLIWHSQDLINWEPIIRAVPEYEGSAMAPDLIKHEGRFYLYFPSAGTNWVVWADDIKGPWSKPVDLRVTGIDPGHILGEDGKRYLYVNDGRMIQLSDDGLSTVGELKKAYDGWEFPKSWETEGMWLESPKFLKRDGYYYQISAQGGTAGPPTSHMVVVARSKSVHGPWENSPYNPIVHTYSVNDNWWSKGHGTIIDDVNGNWWIIYHAYANGYHTLGRQTLLEPIEWTSDGWYKLAYKAQPIVPQAQIKHGLELSDKFDGNKLWLQWTFWKEYAPESVVIKGNTLSLNAKGTSPADARKLLITATGKNYETQVEVQTAKGNKAGLVLFYNEKAYAGILADEKQFTIYKDAETSFNVSHKLGKRFFLKIENRGNTCIFSASKDNKSWTVLAEDIDVSEFHHNKYKEFYALRPALVSSGKGKALFRDFGYSDAVPTEDDMSVYLMVFHNDGTHSLHMALSVDGYSFMALNDGKPVIAGDTIADQKGIRDPHIVRGPDGAFYMAMTDLHVFGKRDGVRDSEWERDRNLYGWGNNRGLVLMKSWDLVDWKRTNIRFDELSAQFKEVGCVWAPQTTYDEEKGKLMIYFTMRYQNEPNKLYYTYVNEAFDCLETTPQILFEYPDEKVSAIDGDITKVNGKYHLLYVSHDGQAGIKQAVSDKINGGYEFDPRWYDPEEKACEAPNVWKRIGEEKWVLMYDCYGQAVHNFGFSETSDFVNFKNLGQFNQGVMKTTNFASPKHGAIIQITKQEADRLAKHWRLDIEFPTAEEFRSNISNRPADLSEAPNVSNPVLPGLYADPEVLYSEKTGKYYIYPTSDGFKGWTGTYFKAFSSDDLKTWKDEGIILDLEKDVSWADRNAWAPAIIEKKDKHGNYKYYYYFTAAQKIGVAVA
ncbi:MAG TPA: glycosyl hydrolase family 43, partial [Porphyromonadaceae bacterium]|nr:glycosyl hydrolase family 43 [Porphyromonadaceae bacterium]